MYIKLTPQLKIIIAAVSILAPLPIMFYLVESLVTKRVTMLAFREVRFALPVSMNFNLGVGLCILVALLPYAIISYINERYISKIERDLPIFFRELAESVRAGLPLIKAIEEVSRRGVGPLRDEMKRVVFRVALGVPFEEALNTFTKKVDIYSTRVMSVILSEAYASGARVIEVLETASDVYGMLLSFKMERDAKITPYVWVIYISLLLFLIISTTLIEVFFKPLSILTRGLPLLGGTIDPRLTRAMFYYASLIEAISGGLIVGKMKGGRISSSLIHVVILMVITLVYYAVFVPLVSRLIAPVLPL